MALQPCNQCDEAISPDVSECPRCGAWRPTAHAAKVGRFNDVIIVIFGLLVLGFIVAFCA